MPLWSFCHSVVVGKLSLTAPSMAGQWMNVSGRVQNTVSWLVRDCRISDVYHGLLIIIAELLLASQFALSASQGCWPFFGILFYGCWNCYLFSVFRYRRRIGHFFLLIRHYLKIFSTFCFYALIIIHDNNHTRHPKMSNRQIIRELQ